MAIKGLKAGGVTVQSTDSDKIFSGTFFTLGAGGNTWYQLENPDGSDSIAGINGAVVGYIKAAGLDVNFTNLSMGYADNNSGLNRVDLIPERIFIPSQNDVFDFFPIALTIPSGKFLGFFNANAGNAGFSGFMQWTDLD